MESLTIYIDRLKQGQKVKIEETVPSDFLEVHEKELSFPSKVTISGEAYLTSDHVMIHLDIETTTLLPCSICNEPVLFPLAILSHYIAKPLEEIKGAIFNLSEEIRETILLQIPPFTECHNGRCPERKEMEKFLKSPSPTTDPTLNVAHFPFSNL